uniref:Uncharacterized protein n=1 Tax=Anguilla anguilla TaxID=7936 RepID=A0A0E9WN02_ANGAN
MCGCVVAKDAGNVKIVLQWRRCKDGRRIRRKDCALDTER